MNFFQFAQSSKNKPLSNAFASSPSSFIQFPSIPKDEVKSEIEKSVEDSNIKPSSEVQNSSKLPQNSGSPFIFNPRKVTFANPETNKSVEPSIKVNTGLLSQPQSSIPQILSDSTDVQIAKNEEVEYNNEIKNNNEDITNDNLEEQMARLENDFKLISSWSQKQMSSLQQLQEEISMSSLKGNELLANINSILNS